jgi:hypothetical protein
VMGGCAEAEHIVQLMREAYVSCQEADLSRVSRVAAAVASIRMYSGRKALFVCIYYVCMSFLVPQKYDRREVCMIQTHVRMHIMHTHILPHTCIYI